MPIVCEVIIDFFQAIGKGFPHSIVNAGNNAVGRIVLQLHSTGQIGIPEHIAHDLFHLILRKVQICDINGAFRTMTIFIEGVGERGTHHLIGVASAFLHCVGQILVHRCALNNLAFFVQTLPCLFNKIRRRCEHGSFSRFCLIRRPRSCCDSNCTQHGDGQQKCENSLNCFFHRIRSPLNKCYFSQSMLCVCIYV